MAATEVMTKQSQYRFVTEVSQDGDYLPLFNCGGLTLEMLFGPPPDAPDIQETINANSNLRSTANTAAMLEARPQQIVEQLRLAATDGKRGASEPGPSDLPGPAASPGPVEDLEIGDGGEG